MNRILSLALMLSVLCCYCAPGAGASGGGRRTKRDLQIHGETRSYVLYRPALPDGGKVPLMIVLHGGLGNAETIEASTGMDAVADRGRFIVAYPEGTEGRALQMKDRRTWNAGTCCGQAVRQQADDVGFISTMIDDIAAREPIDLRRVYVTGMSNGAMMAYRLACQIPERIAAVIPVAGALTVDDCSKAKDVPVLHIHGDSDRNVPIAGGMGEASLADVAFRPLSETMRLITSARRCSGSETDTLNSLVERTTYHCAGGAPVELVIIKGGGHIWPGGLRDQEEGTPPLSASQMAWDFARQFTKKP